MKLKQIPQNTVVRTPTEEEVKELFAILHENGWSTHSSENYAIKNAEGIQVASETGWSWWKNIENARKENRTIITLAEFKERYCEEEKPQPKYHLGERIRIASSGEEDFINVITEDDCYQLLEHRGKYTESDLIPYTEPETKPTEDMETKENRNLSQDVANCDKPEDKELNLCELLKGHEGKEFFSLAYGAVVLEEIRRGTQRGDSPDFLCVRATSFDSGTIIVNPNGKLRNAGVVDLVPSRALYERYPLDPYAAWMKWQEEQTIYHIRIEFQSYDERGEMKCGNMSTLHFDDLKFRTPADRDKCIEEIKAIIEKYSKK